MSKLKSHFKFTPKQRNGILLLLLVLIFMQTLLYLYSRHNPSEDFQLDDDLLESYRREVDSLKHLAIENNKPKIYPFNPNFITDYKGYTLGMSNEEIDRLLQFRRKDKWINSTKEFQKVTQVSDSLLSEIAPYFKFPEWVTNPKPRAIYTSFTNHSKPKTFQQKIDLNIATAKQLKKVNGIGEKLSERIVKYRNKVGGFSSEVQLSEIYGLTDEVIERIKEHFAVKTPKRIHKVELNTASVEELVLIPHIDYEVAHNIVEQRILREGFTSLDELTKVKEFPKKKIEIIKLYLILEKKH